MKATFKAKGKTDNQSIRLAGLTFIILNIVFAFYHITFFWGNHDWDWVKGTTQVLSLNTGMFEGRYAKFILNVTLFGGQILPILNNIVALGLLSFGVALLTSYWQIKDFMARFITALVMMTAPYVLGWLYFPINILGNFSAVALVAYGLVLSEKNKWYHKVFSVICFLLALGVYPSVAEMMIVCFMIRHIIAPIRKHQQLFASFSLLIISLICFKLLLFVLGKLDIVYSEHYNMQTPSLAELIKSIPQTIALMFSQLLTTLPFLDVKYKILSLLLLILAITATYKRWLWWGIALGATVLSTFLTTAQEETAYMPRINFYGINFLIAGAVAVLFTQKQKIRNISSVLCLLLLWNGVTADFEAFKVWRLGQIAESALVERISAKIEEITPDKVLIPVIAGELPLRPRYYASSYQKNSPYVLNGSLLVRHIPSGMFNFYAVTPFFYNYSQIADLSPELHHFLQIAHRPWPAKDALFINDKYAVILLTNEGINAIQAQLPY